MTAAAEEIGLLTTDQLVHHQLAHRRYQIEDDVAVPVTAAIKQLTQPLSRAIIDETALRDGLVLYVGF